MGTQTTTAATTEGHARAARHLVWLAVRRHWRSLSAGGVGAVMVTVADLAAPFPLAWVIDKLLTGRDIPFSFTSGDIRTLAILVQAVVLIAIVAALGQYLADVSLQRAGEQITHDLRLQTYEHLQRLSLAFHDQRRKGDLVTRLTGDVNSIGSLFSGVIGNIVQAVLVLIGMVVVTLILDPMLAIVLYAAVPILFFVTRTFRRRIRRAARDQRKAEAEIASLANESLSAIRVVKAFGAEEYEHERVTDQSEQRRRVGVAAAALDAKFGGIVDVLGALTMATVLAFGATRVSSGAVTVGGLVIFLHYARRVYRPLRDIAKYSTHASRAMARAERIADVLATDDTLSEVPGAYRGPRAKGAIAMEHVAFGYRPEQPVVRDVSLEIAPGETVAIVGPSGAGKSTIGALVARFYDPSDGRVLIDGRDARECSLGWLRDQVGFLLQDTVLFSGTIAENIAYGLEMDRDAVIRAARLADAHEFITALPDGYDTMLGPQGVGLSGGQRQRIGVARVLLRDPAILILDEPTTGLDATSEALLIDGLSGLMSGRTSILVTHSLALARRADRVIVIADGRAVQQGTPAELLAAPGTFRRLAALQGLVGQERPPRPAPDAGLPEMRHLLDLDAVAEALEATLPSGRSLRDLRVRDVRYRPGVRATVHFAADIDGVEHDAVIATGRGVRATAFDPANLALAAQVNGRSPVERPLSFDERLGAMVQWLPLDVAIPLTALPPDEMARRLTESGVPIAAPADEPDRLDYRPGRRVTWGFGLRQVTCWARPGDRAQAQRSLEFAVSAGLISGVAGGDGLDALHVTAPLVHPGSRVPDPLAAARDAGALLATIHRLESATLGGTHPAQDLLAVHRVVAQLEAIRPELRDRLDALVSRIVETGPRASDLGWVTAHANFRPASLRVRDGLLELGEWNTFTRAPAALDIASYAASVFERSDDWQVGHDALGRLVAGYGEVPHALDWYLGTAILRRATRPFRHQASDWPDQVDGLVALAEAIID